MSLVSCEYERENMRVRFIVPDLSFATFVAKIQKAKTRKDKDYFVMRATVPKDVAKKIDVKPGDYLFFKVKKAEWYHMLDWEKMETTWRMLPQNVKYQAISEGVPYPGATDQTTTPIEDLPAFGGTSPLIQKEQVEICKTT
jgi:hypothetical protein